MCHNYNRKRKLKNSDSDIEARDEEPRETMRIV